MVSNFHSCEVVDRGGSWVKIKSKNLYRRQINLYRMFFADYSVNSQPILMKF